MKKRLLHGIVSIALVSAIGTTMGITAYADTETTTATTEKEVIAVMDGKTIYDTNDDICENGYSYNQILSIMDNVIKCVSSYPDADSDYLFRVGTHTVFDDNDNVRYTYIEASTNDKDSIEYINDFCKEEGYSNVVTVEYNPYITPVQDASGVIDEEEDSLSVPVNTYSLLALKGYIIGANKEIGNKFDLNQDGNINTLDLLILKRTILTDTNS